MARGFSTGGYGTATTDRIAFGSTYPDPATVSIHCWIWQHGSGGSNLGRIFDIGNTGQFALLNSGTSLQITSVWSGATAAWTFARPTFDTWASVGVKFDNSLDSNDPTAYLANVKKTIGSGLTQATAPSGTVTAIDTGYLGNGPASNRVWDGMIAEFAIWNILLDDDEFFALGKGFRPTLIRPASLIYYDPMVRDNVSLKGGAPTITGALPQPHPPVLY
jgi:hypothetical protein